MAAEGFRVKSFPFTAGEWAAVADAALPVVNAGVAGDLVSRASHLARLFGVLAHLRSRHGDHPVLFETEADFTQDDSERVALYRRAARVAEAHGIRTLGIRLSLARVLLDIGEPRAAGVELLACESELADGDESERASWAELAVESRLA